MRVRVLLALAAAPFVHGIEVLTAATFETFVTANSEALVSFIAPWCGHCKKLTPELDKATNALQGRAALATVDAIQDKELAAKYNVQGYPTLLWFQNGKQYNYTGGRTSESIVEWVVSMTGQAVIETDTPPPSSNDRPQVILLAPGLLPGFEAAAKEGRRKASWYFVKSGLTKVVVNHPGEPQVVMTQNCGDQAAVTRFVEDNMFPLFGRLDGDTFDKYMDAGKGLVWSLFAPQAGQTEFPQPSQRTTMLEVANKFRGKYFVTYTDPSKFKEAIENMLAVTKFPAIAVQKQAGSKRRYVYEGPMISSKIISFIQDVEAGKLAPRLRSDAVPVPNDEPVRIVVGTTIKKEVFTADKDVLLEVYAPWCGHCKKLEPEYLKLARKVKKEELHDLLTIAKIDGTANDSPVDALDWTSFPTIYFIKAGSDQPILYDGERTAKGLWKYVKKHSTKAQEIRDRLERRKNFNRREEEL